MGSRTGGVPTTQPQQMRQPRNMMRSQSAGVTPRQGMAAPSGDLDPAANPMANRAAMAQQRRNRMFGATQAPFNQFTGGAQYIGAANGAQLGQPNLGQGVLYDYGNGQYKFGADPSNLQDIYGNWTFLRS